MRGQYFYSFTYRKGSSGFTYLNNRYVKITSYVTKLTSVELTILKDMVRKYVQEYMFQLITDY